MTERKKTTNSSSGCGKKNLSSPLNSSSSLFDLSKKHSSVPSTKNPGPGWRQHLDASSPARSPPEELPASELSGER